MRFISSGLPIYLDEYGIDMPLPVRLWPAAITQWEAVVEADTMGRERDLTTLFAYHDYHGLGAPTDLSEEKLPS